MDQTGSSTISPPNGVHENGKITNEPPKAKENVQLGQIATRSDGIHEPMITFVDQDSSETSSKNIDVADLFGELGLYQLSLALLATLRFVSVAMPVNYGPLITPVLNYSCQLPNSSFASQILTKPNQTLSEYLSNRCHLDLKTGGTLKCNSWTYDDAELGDNLTEAFDLVCDRDWLRSAFSSVLSTGVAVGAIAFGIVSDKYGRLNATKVCFMISLIGGIVSCLVNNLAIFYISRVLCSIGDLGLVVSLSTIITETFGNKYRAATLLNIYTGWAFGVMLAPIAVGYFRDFRDLMVFTTLAHFIFLPWLLTIKESVRWSLVHGRVDEAYKNSKAIYKLNSRPQDGTFDKKFNMFKQKFMTRFEVNSNKPPKSMLESIFGALMQCFQNKPMALTTIALIWITFNSELLYMFCIQINSDIGENVKLNYLLGGIMEILATVLSIVMIEKMTRKFSTILTIIFICAFNFAMAFLYKDPGWLLWVLNADKLAVSTYSSLVYVLANECYPTSLRQTGAGLTSTIGSIGSIVAPFFRYELVRLIGLSNVFFILTITPLTAALMVQLFISETKDVNLPDDIEDIKPHSKQAVK